MTATLMITCALLAGALALAAAIALLLALCAACGAAAAWGWTPVAAAVYAKRQRRLLADLDLPPSQTYRPLPQLMADDVLTTECSDYWAAAREASAEAEAEEDVHAAAMAAVADDVPLPERTAAAGAERPLPATVPMPTVDVTAVLPVPAPYAVRWAFDPAGARTIVPERAGRWAA